MSALNVRPLRRRAQIVLPLLVSAQALIWAQAMAQTPAAPAQAASTATTSTGARTNASASAQSATGAAPPSEPAPPSHRTSRRSKKVHRTAEETVLHDVQAAATEQPKKLDFVNATLHYAWEPGKIYTIHTAPDFLTTIALRPGEKLVSKAAGDTTRWIVGETAEGSGAEPQTIIIIKPLEAGLHTNLILTTDQRMYQLNLVSTDSGDYSTAVDWNYPAEDLRNLQVQRAALTVQALAAKSANLPGSPFITPPLGMAGPSGIARGGAPGLRLASTEEEIPAENLHFSYKIVAKHAPRWEPQHVFDDGKKTYIKFPDAIATMELPLIWLIGPKGQLELVNYRYVKGFYVVDRLFDKAELRLGVDDKNAVQIDYTGGAR